MKTENESKKDYEKWPWDWHIEQLTDESLKKIVENLPFYANDAVYRKPEEVGMSRSLEEGFLHYSYKVKDYLTKAATDAPNCAKTKVSEIVDDALQQIDTLVHYVEHPDDKGCSPTELCCQWDTVTRKLGIITTASRQKLKQDIAPGKWRSLREGIKKVAEKGWQIFTQSFWEAVFDRLFHK